MLLTTRSGLCHTIAVSKKSEEKEGQTKFLASSRKHSNIYEL
jgi:hypothetical protein